MPITTISSREFNQNGSLAKKATKAGPVFITDRGKPSLVLLSFEEYQRITVKKQTLADALSMPGLSDIDLESELVRPREIPRAFEFD